MIKSELASMIDHTVLGPTTVKKDVERVCEEAQEYGFSAVCIDPVFVSLASRLLQESDVSIATVIGFPHGSHKRGSKGFEAQIAVEDGADELDMVANLSALLDKDYYAVAKDISAVTDVARKSTRDIIVKVILEMGLLDAEAKRAGCIIAQASGADMVKTSTGFGPSGAEIEDVKLMRQLVAGEVGVKAAGGIGNYEQAMAMIEAGATRIGASSGVEIVMGAPDSSD